MGGCPRRRVEVRNINNPPPSSGGGLFPDNSGRTGRQPGLPTAPLTHGGDMSAGGIQEDKLGLGIEVPGMCVVAAQVRAQGGEFVRTKFVGGGLVQAFRRKKRKWFRGNFHRFLFIVVESLKKKLGRILKKSVHGEVQSFGGVSKNSTRKLFIRKRQQSKTRFRLGQVLGFGRGSEQKYDEIEG